MRKPSRRMKHMLDTVNDRGPARALGNIDDTFEAEESVTAMLGQHFEKKRQRYCVDRRIAHDSIGLNLRVVPRMHRAAGVCCFS